jgi:hypothetical protein
VFDVWLVAGARSLPPNVETRHSLDLGIVTGPNGFEGMKICENLNAVDLALPA